MDLPTLMSELNADERRTLLEVLDRGVTATPRRHRSAASHLCTRIRAAMHTTPNLDRGTASVLLMLFSAPRGLRLAGVHPHVLDLLETQDRIVGHGGRWFITRSAASILYAGRYADEIIDRAAAVRA